MASNSEEFNIILNVLNRDKIDQARTAIAQEEEAIRRLSAELKAGQISQDQFAASAARSAQAIQGYNATIRSASGAFNPRSLLEFSRAAEDAQYGVAGVVNNIPGLVASLGGGAGLVGVISLAAIGVAQLVKNWDSLASAFGGGHVKTQAEEMEELRKKTSLTADEAERLARATATTTKVKELQGGQTEAEKKQDDAASKAIIEAGFRDVAAGVLRSRPDLVDGQGDAAVAKVEVEKAKKELQNAKDNAGNTEDYGAAIDGAEKRLLKANLKLAEAREKTAQELAANGTLARLFPGGLKQLQDSVATNPDAFGPKAGQLQHDLKEAAKTPEDREEEEWKNHQKDLANAEAKRQADLDYKKFQEEERLDKESLEHFNRIHAENEQRAANAAFEAQQKIDDENMNAALQDRMSNWRKHREEGQKNSQVFNDATSLRDAIQQSIKGPDRDPTAVEQLETQRKMYEEIKRGNEMKNKIGPARLG